MALHKALVILLLLVCPALSQEQWSGTYSTGSSATHVGPFIRVVNKSSYNKMSVGYLHTNGTYNNPLYFVPAGSPSGFQAIVNNGYTSGGGFYQDIAVDAHQDFPIGMYWGWGTSSTGSYALGWNVTVTARYYNALGTLTATKTYVRPLVINAILNKAPGLTPTHSGPVQVMLIEASDDPIRGRVRVTPFFTGPYSIVFNPGSTVTMNGVANTQGEYLTANPENFANGAVITIVLNGETLATQTITKDAEGGFLNEFVLIEPPPPPDPNAAPSPDEMLSDTQPEDGKNVSSTRGELGGRVTPDAGGATGAGAEASDDTSPVDSVADSYRATRQAMTDALNSDVNTGANPELGELSDAGTTGRAAAVSDLVGDSPIAGDLLSMPAIGISGLNVNFFGSNIFLAVPSWAPVLRGILNWFIAICVLSTLISRVRSAFA